MGRRQRSSGRRRLASVYSVSVTAALLLTAGLTFLLVRRLNFPLLVAYLLAVNTATLLAYAYDKGIAGGERQRVPERVLHCLAFFGGTPAALLGQLTFRHKTRKSAFRAWFWAIFALQAAALGTWLWVQFR